MSRYAAEPRFARAAGGRDRTRFHSLFAGELGLVDRSVKVTAVEGAQTIAVRLNDDGKPPTLPFAAEMAGACWAVAWTDDSEVVVAATSAGAGFPLPAGSTSFPGTGIVVAEVGGRSIEVTVQVVEATDTSTRSATTAPVISVPPTRGLRAGG